MPLPLLLGCTTAARARGAWTYRAGAQPSSAASRPSSRSTARLDPSSRGEETVSRFRSRHPAHPGHPKKAHTAYVPPGSESAVRHLPSLHVIPPADSASRATSSTTCGHLQEQRPRSSRAPKLDVDAARPLAAGEAFVARPRPQHSQHTAPSDSRHTEVWMGFALPSASRVRARTSG